MLVSWLSLAGLFGGLRALVVVVMVGVVVRRGWRHDVNAGNTSCDLCFKSLFARDSGRDVLITMAYHGMLLVWSFAVWGSPLEDNAYNPNYMSTHSNTNTNTNANANTDTYTNAVTNTSTSTSTNTNTNSKNKDNNNNDHDAKNIINKCKNQHHHHS